MNQVKYLLTYRYAEIIQDLNFQFCTLFIHKFSRTNDQMIQAARSGKQNIVEGVGQSQTSKRGEIKLLGVAKASFEELLSDYEDYLRQNNLSIFAKSDSRITNFRHRAYALSSLCNLSDSGNIVVKPNLPPDAELAANLNITLCHIVTYLLNRQIVSLITQFEQYGGITEMLYTNRKTFKFKK